jgi:DNA-directed RNA polymerase specialized sigma24 family protein
MNEKRAIYRFWISQNYKRLIRKEKAKISFDEDAFHNALIDLWEELGQLSGVNLTILDKLFATLYKGNISKNVSYNIKFRYFDNEILDFIVSQPVLEENADEEVNVNDRYLELVKKQLRTFPSDDQRLFLLHAENELSITDLSRYTGLPEVVISDKLSYMKESIMKNIQRYEPSTCY